MMKKIWLGFSVLAFSFVWLSPVASAAGSATLYLNPASGSVKNGNTIILGVYVNSGSEPINAVQANLTYSTSQLTYIGYSSSSAFSIEAENPSGNTGALRFARGTTTPKTGVQQVVSVTFRAAASSGTAAVNFSSSSAVLSSNSNTDILSTTTGGQYVLSPSSSTSPPPPPPPPPAEPSPSPSPTPPSSGGSTTGSTPPASSSSGSPGSSAQSGNPSSAISNIIPDSSATETNEDEQSGSFIGAYELNGIAKAVVGVVASAGALFVATAIFHTVKQRRLAQEELRRHFPFTDSGNNKNTPLKPTQPQGPTVINPTVR